MNIDRKLAGSATALSDSRTISAVVKLSPTHRPPTIKEHYEDDDDIDDDDNDKISSVVTFLSCMVDNADTILALD